MKIVSVFLTSLALVAAVPLAHLSQTTTNHPDIKEDDAKRFLTHMNDDEDKDEGKMAGTGLCPKGDFLLDHWARVNKNDDSEVTEEGFVTLFAATAYAKAIDPSRKGGYMQYLSSLFQTGVMMMGPSSGDKNKEEALDQHAFKAIALLAWEYYAREGHGFCSLASGPTEETFSGPSEQAEGTGKETDWSQGEQEYDHPHEASPLIAPPTFADNHEAAAGGEEGDNANGAGEVATELSVAPLAPEPKIVAHGAPAAAAPAAPAPEEAAPAAPAASAAAEAPAADKGEEEDDHHHHF